MLNTKAELQPLTEETIARIRAITEDPIDAVRLAADLYATNAYMAERATAIEAGLALPRPPKPISMYMRAFATTIKAKLSAMSTMFRPDEIARLNRIGSALAKELERDGGDLIESLVVVMAMDPVDAVLWIRAHLDEIDARFAS